MQKSMPSTMTAPIRCGTDARTERLTKCDVDAAVDCLLTPPLLSLLSLLPLLPLPLPLPLLPLLLPLRGSGQVRSGQFAGECSGAPSNRSTVANDSTGSRLSRVGCLTG